MISKIVALVGREINVDKPLVDGPAALAARVSGIAFRIAPRQRPLDGGSRLSPSEGRRVRRRVLVARCPVHYPPQGEWHFADFIDR
jgi:hypothetical protein